MNKNIETKVRNHGNSLLELFPDAITRDPVELCRKLRRQEAVAHGYSVQHCSTGIEEAELDKRIETTLRNVRAILGIDLETQKRVGLFVNLDPRGYALKLDDGFAREWNRTAARPIYSDWGGYAILAPDLA